MQLSGARQAAGHSALASHWPPSLWCTFGVRAVWRCRWCVVLVVLSCVPIFSTLHKAREPRCVREVFSRACTRERLVSLVRRGVFFFLIKNI